MIVLRLTQPCDRLRLKRYGGLITLALAIAQFVTPIMHGRLPKLVAIAAASSFWMFVAVMFAQVGGIKTGTAVYGALSVFLFLRAYEIES